ncbi:MAG: hypothetical protein LC104_16130 [Bacteroidales bacterium]|nr:hypothetical protein [Bacteroidales bacterium]
MPRAWAVLILSLAFAPVSAQEPPTAVATPAGTVPSTFRSFIASDLRYPAESVRNRQAKMHCLICEAGLNPVIAVFARTDPATLTADTPLGKLIQTLGRPTADKDPGGFVAKHRAANAAAFVLFLTLDKPYPSDDRGEAVKGLVRDEQAQALRNAAEQLKAPGVPLALAATASPATEAWKLDPAQEITVVVYNRMRIVKRWEFNADHPLNDEAIADILKTGEQAITGK